MNGIQFDLFRGFKPPAEESMLTSRFFGRLMSNILTLGVDAATKTVGYQSRIYELEKEQALLLKKYAHVKENWKSIEQSLEKMIEAVLALQGEDEESSEINELQKEVDQIAIDKEELDEESIEIKEESDFIYLSRKIVGILNVLIQYSTELSSLGFNGCYEGLLLKNRIKILKAQNDFLEKGLADLQAEHQSFFEKNIDLLKQSIGCKSDLINISQTEPAKAYFEVTDLNQQLQKLKKKEEDLKKQISSLQTQYKTAKEGEDKLTKLLKQTSDENNDNAKTIQDLKHQITQLEKDQKELKTLRQQMQSVGDPGNVEKDPAFDNLQKRAGPLPSKYQPTKQELESIGKLKEESKFTNAFTKRYADIDMAAEVFKVGFAYALKEIFQMADKGIIKLNRSLGTPTSKGAQVAYRFLALDWIKGGKGVATCNGYELQLNNKEVKLVPSSPENVLKYQIVDGKRQATIAIHFNARCDLVPGEEILKHTSAACGIDPIAAKCLWGKLSDEERKHFFTLMLDPAVEDDDANYMVSVAYISRLSAQKQKEIYILRDLISDIGVALEAKFKSDIAMQEWQQYLDVIDFDLQPFAKKEKEDPFVIVNSIQGGREEPLIPWQIDFDILSATTKGVETQTDFYALILDAQETHQVYFDHLKSSLLQHPMSEGKVIHNITWDQLKRQFHTTHQIIGNQGCLLSNFLAVLMVDQKDLISENITKLKIAMAHYLDNPYHAKEFEGALKNEFNCTVAKFKDWLRGKNSFLNGVELTPTILAIAAYTLGVRVVLFTPPSDSGDFARTKVKADEYGRWMPVEEIEGHHFGPPTKEVFFMAVENNYSYYGLFPKMKIKGASPSKLNIPTNDWEEIESLDAYWRSIETTI